MDDAALHVVADQLLQGRDHLLLKSGDGLPGIDEFAHVFGEIDPGLQAHQQIEAEGPDRLHRLPQAPFQLGGGRRKAAFGAGIDEVRHGLGLGQIDASI